MDCSFSQTDYTACLENTAPGTIGLQIDHQQVKRVGAEVKYRNPHRNQLW
jgi:hypothetical protein